MHDVIVGLVEQVTTLYKRRSEAQLEQDRTMLQQRITIIEKQIDRQVYTLYALSEEEIALVEKEVS